MAKKTDDAEVTRRVDQIFHLMVKGKSRLQILQHASEKTTWKVSERTVDEYIARAKKLLAKHSEPKKAVELGKAFLRLEYLFDQNLGINDFKAALAVQKEINAMLGLNAPKALEIQTWETKALDYIKEGKVKYPAFAAEFGTDLATKLFQQAGVPVEVEA